MSLRLPAILFHVGSLLLCLPATAADDLATKLPGNPAGPGFRASDRAVWDPLGATPPGKKTIAEAEKLLKEPMPAFDPQLYQEFYRNGNRTNFQNQNGKRWERFRNLVKAECFEGKRRFVPALAESIGSLCGDPSWCLPAHDQEGWIFKGNKPYVDLMVAMSGFDMATALWLLEDRLPAETLTLARANIRHRLTGPVMEQIAGNDPKFYKAHQWWATANHNWNAVCTAGGVGAILLTEPSREDRANAIRWATGNMKIFLSGFAADGYCSEGISYWGYGFGHFSVLAEAVSKQTAGTVDWIASERVRQITGAVMGQEIIPGAFPGFADAPMKSSPSSIVVDYLARRGACPGAKPMGRIDVLTGTKSLYEAAYFGFASQSAAAAKPAALPERCWLPDGGVYVGRSTGPDAISVAWKGGNNAEHHNHNDVGTTIVYQRGQSLLCDPGAMVYTAETFSKERYRFPVMSSYGHSVPVVDETLQSDGAASRGLVLNTDFSPEKDRITLDIRSCYQVDGLKKLEREWTYDRSRDSGLAIEDRFDCERAIPFEMSLIGLGTWQRIEPGLLLITGANKAALTVRLVSSQPVTTRIAKIINPGHTDVMRLGIRLDSPQSSGWIRAIVTPATADAVSKAKPMKIDLETPAKLPPPVKRTAAAR